MIRIHISNVFFAYTSGWSDQLLVVSLLEHRFKTLWRRRCHFGPRPSSFFLGGVYRHSTDGTKPASNGSGNPEKFGGFRRLGGSLRLGCEILCD